MKIVLGKKELRKKTKPVDLSEGLEIGKDLLKIINEHGNAIGLAANQIRIDKRVCVVNVIKPIILVNPEITGKFGKIEYTEGCLSFPGEIIKTTRYSNIVVRDANNGTVVYEPKDAEHLLEIVCIQHEIDHLNGIVMHDRQVADIDLATII